MKPPKFTGHKKGKAEIWLGEYKFRPDCYGDRIRIRYPDGVWKWAYADEGFATTYWDYRNPCWLIGRADRVRQMKDYDLNECRETIFLGYF
jgi:hypothetical protein